MAGEVPRYGEGMKGLQFLQLSYDEPDAGLGFRSLRVGTVDIRIPWIRARA